MDFVFTTFNALAYGTLLTSIPVESMIGYNRIVMKNPLAELPNSYISFLAAADPIGGMIGTSTVQFYASKFGTIPSVRVLSLIGIILLALVEIPVHPIFLGIVRILFAICIGSQFILMPEFISKRYDASQRKMYMSTFSILINLGLLISYCFNLLSYWCASMSVVLACEVLVFASSWFLKKESVVEQQNNEEVEVEMEEKPKLNMWKAVLVSIGLASSEMTTGINSVLNFASVITAGAIPNNTRLGAVVIGSANLVAIIIAMPFAERFKRKTLLGIGYVGCVVMNIVVAFAFAYQQKVLQIVSFVIFFLFYQLAPGPIILALCGEAFPRSIIIPMNSLGFTVNWLVNVATVYIYPYYPKSIEYVPYIIYAVTTALLAAMTMVLTPETMNKSPEQIEQAYLCNPEIVKSEQSEPIISADAIEATAGTTAAEKEPSEE